jgi:hypothetical protein
MKKILFLFLIFGSTLVNAQNWTCIKPLAIIHFSGSNAEIRSIRIDSTSIHGDTIDYFNYYMIRQTDWNCYKLKGASWTGIKISALANGYDIFYNHKNIPISIKTNATLNETWHLYDYPDARYIEAKIIQFDTMTFLGITDSVKTISLQMKDSFGNSINALAPGDSIDMINNITIKFSKSYGFIKIIDFYRFPDYTHSFDHIYNNYYHVFDIIGMSNPIVGYQNLTAYDVFNIDPGDEIHTFEESMTYGNPTSGFIIKTINKYLTKTVSINQDTVTYLVNRCRRRTDFQFPDSTISYNNDTITLKYILSNYSRLNHLSFEPFHTSSFSYSFCTAIGNTKYISSYNEFLSNLPDTCLSEILATAVPIYSYTKGLGEYYDNYSSGLEPIGKNVLVYYKKGIVEWGTPYDCSILVSIREDNVNFGNNINISPNPFSQSTHINFGQTYGDIALEVYNLQGQRVAENHYAACNEITLQRNGLRQGMYFLKLTLDGKMVETRKMVISE